MTSQTELNAHGQPAEAKYNYKRNKAKAVLTLKGIIEGIHCDGQINEAEELFIRAWKENDIFRHNDGDFNDIHEQIDDILEDSVITEEEKQDLLNMLNDILNYGSLLGNKITALTNQLLGFLNGISADNDLNDKEIIYLNKLLKSSPELLEHWPGNALNLRLDEILEDGYIDEEERSDLLNLVKAVSGQKLLDTGLAYGMSADYSTTEDTCLSLNGLNICFTGQFLSGTRKVQQEYAKSFGANVCKGVNQKLDILILGSIASRDWKFSSYGNKIHDVLANRSKGAGTEIINEDTWNELISLR